MKNLIKTEPKKGLDKMAENYFKEQIKPAIKKIKKETSKDIKRNK